MGWCRRRSRFRLGRRLWRRPGRRWDGFRLRDRRRDYRRRRRGRLGRRGRREFRLASELASQSAWVSGFRSASGSASQWAWASGFRLVLGSASRSAWVSGFRLASGLALSGRRRRGWRSASGSGSGSASGFRSASGLAPGSRSRSAWARYGRRGAVSVAPPRSRERPPLQRLELRAVQRAAAWAARRCRRPRPHAVRLPRRSPSAAAKPGRMGSFTAWRSVSAPAP